MHEAKSAGRIMGKLAPAGSGVVLVLLWAIAVCGQSTPARGKGQRSAPRLPGAGTRVPGWAGPGDPFDVANFFEPVPRDKNAAPLYLDALFEFANELETCFPEGPDRTRRSAAARDRSKRYNDLVQPTFADPKRELQPAAVDSLIKLYDTGYRKLAEAQRLDQCVFEAGARVTALSPHAQASRQVFRVSSLKVQRAVQRGDLAAAIREVEVVLRLARDLRPRGGNMSQLVADAVSQAVYAATIPIFLASPRLKGEQCAGLIKVLTAHEARSLDGYVEGLRAEYVNARSTLDDVVQHQSDLARAMGLEPGQSVVGAILGRAEPPGTPGGGGPVAPPAESDALVASAKPEEVSRHVKELTRFYKSLLAVDGLPYAVRLERILAVKGHSGFRPALSRGRNVDGFAQGGSVARATSRATASLRADLCLLALKRWQSTHRGLPRDLSSVVRGTGLKDVPVDPYDGKPFKLAVVEGQPVIYSVGRDGKDDGGLVDSDRDQKPSGDLIYRLPPIEAKHALKP